MFSISFLLLPYIAGTYVLKFVEPEKLKRIMLFITMFAGILAIWKFLRVGYGLDEERDH